MKRRELLKSALLTASGAMLLSGCKNNEGEFSSNNSQDMENCSKNNKLTITPKQTGIYQFSSPMLYSYSAIDELAECNKKYKKVKVKTLYNSLPWPLASNYKDWIMLRRAGSNEDIKTFKTFARYVEYSKDKGFDFCYLMNSPRAFNNEDIKDIKPDFYRLLDDLYKIGVRKIKFANTQVAQLINKHNPDFELSVSTIIEYDNMLQYKDLFDFIPNIKQIGVPKDQNQNFYFLMALKKAFPKTEIELMINEGCSKGCLARRFCMASHDNEYKLGCRLVQKYPKLNLYRNGRVTPWNLGYYSAIGINNFKSVPLKERTFDKIQPHLIEILDIAEYGFESERLKSYVLHKLPVKNLDKHIHKFDIKELIDKYFPDIEYLIAKGNTCAYQCGFECDYCEIKARELQKFEDSLNA